MFSIIDVETTGTANATSRMTEIAIICHDGQKIVEQFQSLINPQCWIPSYITQLTGISNDMVRKAPTFEQIADEVRRLTQNTAFVAHNASFDYGFVKREFGRLDEHFERDTLCTVRLSRKIFPGFPTYSLGRLCQSLRIPHTDHHRAMGDAAATMRLFELLLQNDRQGLLKEWIR
jgi:DNA polymerase-3 subunit epsilon